MGFKGNLKVQLAYAGIMIKELATLTGISMHTIENYLNVRSCEPSAENAVRIARVLGVSVEYLVTGEQSLPSHTASLLRPQIRTLVQEAENLDSEDMQIVLNLVKGLKGRKTVPCNAAYGDAKQAGIGADKDGGQEQRNHGETVTVGHGRK